MIMDTVYNSGEVIFMGYKIGLDMVNFNIFLGMS